MPVEDQAVLQYLHKTESYIQAANRLLEEEAPCQLVLQQLNEARRALERAGSPLLCIEVERCLKAMRDNPCPEQRCDQLARLASLYPWADRFNIQLRDLNEVKS